MKVLRLDHVNINTGRLEETIDFYVEGLGLSLGAFPGGLVDPPVEGAWLCDVAGAPIVHLQVVDDGAEGSAAVDHFALGCDDYAGFAARLTGRGIAFEAADFPQIGVRQILVHDPNGVKVELNFPPAG